MEMRPANWLQRLLRTFLRDDLLDAVEGDLIQLYQRRRKTMGRLRANTWYALNVLGFFRPFAWRSLETIHWMLWFRLRLFTRSVRQERFITGARVVGMAIALVVVLTTVQFERQHTRFDQFLSKKDHLYRVNLLATFEEIEGTELGTSHYRMGPLIQDIPEITAVTRVFDSQSGYLKSDKKAFFDRALFADANFFEQFDFPLEHGTADRVLTQPHGVVISSTLSQQLFGDANPVGKPLTVRYGSWIVNPESKEAEAFVSGVFERVPASHLQFDLVTSFQTPNTLDSVKYSGPVVSTYIEAAPDARQEVIESKLAGFYPTHHETLSDMYQPVLQPISDVHLGSASIDSDPLNHQKFDRTYLYIFRLLSLVILVVAMINFIQLTQGIQYRRMKQDAISTALGGSKGALWIQTAFETLILVSMATVLAVLVLTVVQPWMDQIWGLKWNLVALLSMPIVVGWLGVIVLLTLISNVLKPALPTLSKLAASQTTGTSWMSKALIALQLSMGFGLLAGSIVIYRQTQFMLDQNALFAQPYVLQIPMSEDAKANFKTMKSALQGLLAVESVTAGSNAFGGIGGLDLKVKTGGEEKVLILPTLMVDPDYLDFYDIELVEGTHFTPDGKQEFIINETMARQFGWDEPIGQQIGFAFGRPGKVVGVVRDFNYNTLHKKVEAFCFWNTAYYRVISVKVTGANIPETLHAIDNIWQEHVGDAPFSYTFLDDDMRQQYQAEVTTNTLIRYLAGIAIFLAFIGVYSLTYLVAKRRMREASIKKVLGASVSHLVRTFSAPVLVLFGLALFVALPISIFLLENWINTFAYRIQWPVYELVIGGAGLLVVTVVAMIVNILRLARVNPVETLKE